MKKICLNNEYLTEFRTDILKCKPYVNDMYGIVLKESYFYPKSGGQTGDHGYIGNAKVVDVYLENDEIVHLVDRIVEGENISCIVDWARRFDHMQQHTGQHILSGIIERKFGIRSLSFHMGEENSSIETDMKTMENNRIKEIEMLVNDAIFKDIEVKKYFTEREIEGVRKKVDIIGTKRVVEIKGVDISYCGGTHVNRTGEVGIFKIIGKDRVRGNIRIHFKCGYRALYDYQKRFTIVDNLKKILTRDEDSVVESIGSLIEQEKELKKEIKAYRLKELDDFVSKIEEKIYKEKLKGYSDWEIRYIQSKLIETEIESLILNMDTNRLFISVSENKCDQLKAIIERIKEEFGIKGGGSEGKFQFILNDKWEEIYSRFCFVLR